MSSSTFKILYFAAATNYTKCESETLDAPITVSTLFDLLDEKYPGIKAAVLSGSMLTVNLEYADLEDNGMERVIKPGDEVAIIPPVSSG